MSQKISRRDFLGAAITSGILLGIRPTTLLAAELEDKKEDFRIVGKISHEDVKSLEELLSPSPPQPTDADENIRLHVSRFPEIAYNITIENPKNAQETANVVLRSSGSTFLLNNRGFFITAHHVFKDYFQTLGKNIQAVLVYDPQHGFALPARPLVFSKRYDILLGKIDFDSEFPIGSTKISDTDVPPLNHVYSPKYKNKAYITGSLFHEVMKSGRLKFDDKEHTRLVYNQKQTLPKDLRSLDPLVTIGTLLDVEFESGEKLAREGEYIFQSRTIPGDSGNPVLDLKNRLMGVVTKRDFIKSADDGQQLNVGIYTGPFIVREMIQRYIDAMSKTRG